MIEPKEITIDNKNFIISKFPAVAGREIVSQYLSSGLPKVGDYKVNQDIMYKLMSYVGVNVGASAPIMLTTPDLINNHSGGWETLAKIEWEMMEYNCSFFRDGRISTLLERCAQTLPSWISKISTILSASLSQTEKPHSTN